MVSISICMIVKNEEEFLERCLNSVADLAEEIIIVDTGSTDKTKEIAAKYTECIYDFSWIDDFAAARNYAFSKATGDYIYSVDADEVVDEENRQKFLDMKRTLLPEIDIVQMKYANQLSFGTVYNYDEEYRPKLFKRVRHFTWIDPIHETIRIDPVIYDSDIVIGHFPKESHTKRDIFAFQRILSEKGTLNKRLHNMYARELFISGQDQDFIDALTYFEKATMETDRSQQELTEALLVTAKAYRILGNEVFFLKYAMKTVVLEQCSEVCVELGRFYEDREDLEEAVIWYYNAAYETEPVLSLKSKEQYSLQGLVRCYEKMGLSPMASEYEAELKFHLERQ